jgi:hypothetical protein
MDDVLTNEETGEWVNRWKERGTKGQMNRQIEGQTDNRWLE